MHSTTIFIYAAYSVISAATFMCITASLPGWYNGKTLDNRARGRGIDPRSS